MISKGRLKTNWPGKDRPETALNDRALQFRRAVCSPRAFVTETVEWVNKRDLKHSTHRVGSCAKIIEKSDHSRRLLLPGPD
jgi:hypothetical protein